MNLPDQKCNLIESETYQELCHTLNLHVKSPNNNPTGFTGYPTTDLLILNELSDNDLINVCKVNKYINSVCNNESFWLNRIIDRYSGVLGTASMIKNKYMPPNTTWKQYYLWLTALLEGNERTLLSMMIIHDREDLLKLYPNRDVPFSVSTDFIGKTNLGLMDPSDPTSSPVNENLLIKAGITSPRELLLILKLYELINGKNQNLRESLIDDIVLSGEITNGDVQFLDNWSVNSRIKQEMDLLKSLISYWS